MTEKLGCRVGAQTVTPALSECLLMNQHWALPQPGHALQRSHTVSLSVTLALPGPWSRDWPVELHRDLSGRAWAFVCSQEVWDKSVAHAHLRNEQGCASAFPTMATMVSWRELWVRMFLSLFTLIFTCLTVPTETNVFVWFQTIISTHSWFYFPASQDALSNWDLKIHDRCCGCSLKGCESIHEAGRNTEERFIKIRGGWAGQSLLETTAPSLCFIWSFVFSNQHVNCFGL